MRMVLDTARAPTKFTLYMARIPCAAWNAWCFPPWPWEARGLSRLVLRGEAGTATWTWTHFWEPNRGMAGHIDTDWNNGKELDNNSVPDS